MIYSKEKDYFAATVTFLREAVPGLSAVYRFGSAGTPFERPGSDLDIAFLAEKPLPNVRRWELAQELSILLGRDVDLVDLRKSSTVMRLQVVAHGERLYCAQVLEVERFEDLALVSYARLNEERRGILDDIRRRGNVHG